MYSFDELKALKHQPVYEFYAKCDVPFKNTIDLSHYHEKCVRWDGDKQWPNIGNLLNMVNKSPEAIAFKKLYRKLLRSKEYYPTLTIKWRDPQIEGKSYYEYIPAPSYQDVFVFYVNCDRRFKTLKELWDYHEGERWERFEDGSRCRGVKQWPTIGELANAYNYSAEAVSFMQMFEKLKAKDPQRYKHILYHDRSEVEHLGCVNSLSTNRQQPAFDFYSKCTVPFETYGDLKEYHNKCVRYDADKDFTGIDNIFDTTSDSPEAVAFREMYVRLKKRGKRVTLTFHERDPRIPGKSWFEYNPKTTIPLKKKYVYLITCTNQGLVKVGRHSGPMKELHGRYRTCAGRYELTDIFECNDYVNIEKAIHQVLTAYGFHDHLEFFTDVPQVREIWNTFKEMNTKLT